MNSALPFLSHAPLKKLIILVFICGVFSLLFLGCSAGNELQPASGLENTVQDTGTFLSTQNISESDSRPEGAKLLDKTASVPEQLTLQQQTPWTCSLTLSVPADVQVEPVYEHPIFKLAFSRPVQRPQPSEIPKKCTVQKVSFQPQAARKIDELELQLQDEVQYLVSRLQSDQLQLTLCSGQNLHRTLSPTHGQPAELPESDPVSGNELLDINFSRDTEEHFTIQLSAAEQISYELHSAQDKNVSILLQELNIPANLDKFYNLQKFESPARAVWLENIPAGSLMHIKMQEDIAFGTAPFDIVHKGADLLCTFPESPPPARTEDNQPDQHTTAVPFLDPAENTSLTEPEHTPPVQLSAQQSSPVFFTELQTGYAGQPISIDLQQAEVEHVLRLLAEVGNFNLILDEAVQGRISLKLDNVPWDQVLDIVLTQKGLGKERQDQIIRVTTLERLEKEQQLAPLQTEYIQINYAKAEEMKGQVTEFLTEGRGRISVDNRTNQLIVLDTVQKQDQIQSIIQKLDRPERQVMIEARLVYATDTFQRSMGLRWGAEYIEPAGDYGDPTRDEYMVNLRSPGPGGFAMGTFIERVTGSGMFLLDAQLSLGEEKGLAQTISSPRVLTLTNQRAEIDQGTRIRTERLDEAGNTITEYVDALLKLAVTPQITPDNKIILDLDISDDSSPPGAADDIETRSTRTRLMVDDGQTIVLGGVQQFVDESSRGRVPGLANIPLVGQLFKHRHQEQRTNELLIFIQPRIMTN